MADAVWRWPNESWYYWRKLDPVLTTRTHANTYIHKQHWVVKNSHSRKGKVHIHKSTLHLFLHLRPARVCVCNASDDRDFIHVPGQTCLGRMSALISVLVCSSVVGKMAARSAGVVAEELDSWAVHENVWLRRAALLHQLHFDTYTDRDKLFR